MDNLPKRIALVYDWAVKWGGAERVLLALHELYPQAGLFTSVYDEKKAPWAKSFPFVETTFLQHLPFAKSHHEFYALLTPLCFESFNFSNFDLVISVTSADAKGIVTPPNVLHICYCLTPTRYLWSHEQEYKKHLFKPFHPLLKYLKIWDLVAAQRPDRYIAISKTVQVRINKYYGKESKVVYPPVNTHKFRISHAKRNFEKIYFGFRNYYLWVGRFVPYKHPLEVVKVFNELNLPLVMVGTGSELERAKSQAKANITFLGSISDEVLQSTYAQAIALIAVHEEDFGLVSVEAQSMSIPVIGLQEGGISETVIDGQTGILDSDLKTAILRFQQVNFDPETIVSNAQKFSKERFLKEFGKLVSDLWIQHQSTRSF